MFLSLSNLSLLEQREIIDEPITVFDLKKALFDMREEASPGPNGLTVKFFKMFFDELSPLFIKLISAYVKFID